MLLTFVHGAGRISIGGDCRRGVCGFKPVKSVAHRANHAAVPTRRGTVTVKMVLDGELLRQRGRGLSQTGWVAWWVELPLTLTAAAILIFALVTKEASIGAGTSAGLALGVAGVVTCLISVFFAWGYASLGRRMVEGDEAPPVLRTVRLGLYCAAIGCFVALLGVQAVVGTTLGKALSSGLSSSAVVQSRPTVSALDLLIIQGCVNALMSQFVALIVSLNLLLRFRNPKKGP